MDREFPNTSLFLQNLLLMQDNERMRRAAQQLEQENKALLAEIKQRYHHHQQQHQGTGGGPSVSSSGSGSGGGHSASAAAAGANRKAKAVGNGKQPK